MPSNPLSLTLGDLQTSLPPTSALALAEEGLHEYTFRLNKIHVDEARSLVKDTDTVAFSVKAGNNPVQTITRSIGDIGNREERAMNLQLGPFTIT
jgi:hypothetical protein